MISHLFEIIGVVYDNPCDFLCRACPGRFNPRRLKRSPDPVQMHLFSNQMKSMIVPLDSPMSVFPLWLRSSKSGCSGLLIHWSYLGHPLHPLHPLSPRPPPRRPLCHSSLAQEHDGQTSAQLHYPAYHSTSLRLRKSMQASSVANFKTLKTM